MRLQQSGQAVTLNVPLTELQRRQALRYALLAYVFKPTSYFIVCGALMQLFATDVLQLSATEIATILSCLSLLIGMPILLLGWARQIGMRRALLRSVVLKQVVILTLLVLPVATLSLPIYLILLCTYGLADQVHSMVWQPLLHEITESRSRGSFYGVAGFASAAIQVATTAVVVLAVGEHMTAGEYKALLVFAALGTCLALVYASKLARTSTAPALAAERRTGQLRRLWHVIRHSPLLRRPLLIAALLVFSGMPVMVVYLRAMLHVPSTLVTVYLLCQLLATTVASFMWGKAVDSIGFRPLLVGLPTCSMLLSPVLLLVAPFPTDPAHLAQSGWHAFDLRFAINVVALLAVGIGSGVIVAGYGIVFPTLQQTYAHEADALEAINLYAFAISLAAAGTALATGFLLQDIAVPAGSMPFANGVLEFDWIKGYLMVVLPVLQIAAVILIFREAAARPGLLVADFFGTLVNRPFQTIYALADRYSTREDRRILLARQLGRNVNPIGLQPLIQLLKDPATDVRAEAIRSLAFFRERDQAGEALLQMLVAPGQEHLAEHIVWALGLLGYRPAADALLERIEAGQPAGLQARAARALGRLGDRRAIEPLTRLVATAGKDVHLLASACWALARLDARAQAHMLFQVYPEFNRCSERWEMFAAYCEWLALPSDWALRADAECPMTAALLADIEGRGARFQGRHKELIAALRSHDLVGVRAIMEAEMGQRQLTDDDPANALFQVLKERTEWNTLALLSATWILFNTAPRSAAS